MPDNRNTILAVILSGLVLIAWQYFYNVPQMEKRKLAEQAQSELVKPAQPGDTSAAPQAGASPTPQANAPAGTPGTLQPAAAAPVVARDVAIGASPRIKIETPNIVGSIALKGARIDDISLVKFRETVDPNSPPIVLLSPSGSPEPFYAEFGWTGAAGTPLKLPVADTVWKQQGSGALSVGQPVTL